MIDSDPLVLAGAFAATFAASVVLTWAVRGAAPRFGLVSVPRADRWGRRRVALLGGTAIAAAFFAGAVGLSLAAGGAAPLHWPPRAAVVALLAGAALVCGLGLVDDLRPLRPSTKMIGQIACAALLINFGLRLGWTGFEVVDVLLTFFWVIGITNAFNLLDNMDGLSAGIAAIASAFCAVLCAVHGEVGAAALALLLAAATAGFLVFNFNPASVFMGDSGSLFIGFLLAGLTLVDADATGANLSAVVAAPALLLAIPILDTSLVTVMRKLSGRAISQGGRDHSSHRLVALGLSERRAVLLLWALSTAAGAAAVLASIRELPMGRLALPIFAIGLAFLAVYLARVAVYEEAGTRGGPAGRYASLLSALVLKRRIAEVAMDLVLVVLAYYSSYILRFEQSPLDVNLPEFTQSLPAVVACKMLALFACGAYRGLWRYTGVSDLVTCAVASALGGGLSVVALAALYGLGGYSRSLFVIDAILLFVALSASRLSFQLIGALIQRQATAGVPAVIYGAGDGGQVALRELLNNRAHGLAPVGFLDDDPAKRGRKIDGYPVLGGLAELGPVADRRRVGAVVVASDKIAPDRLDRLAEVCRERGIHLRKLRMCIDDVDAGALAPRPSRRIGTRA
jgi:UDP-GlcNAc:undecaprenyl-phosphate GlcNAc-1-phosphate transferase